MKAGNFNVYEYLKKLNEESSAEGGPSGNPKEGIIIPDENKKSFDWLKREYDKAKVEVKVEINMGGSKFQPGYELQTDLKSVKDFKPGMYGNDKTASGPTKNSDIKSEAKDSQEAGKDPEESKENPSEGKVTARAKEKMTGKVKEKMRGKVGTVEDTDKKDDKKPFKK